MIPVIFPQAPVSPNSHIPALASTFPLIPYHIENCFGLSVGHIYSSWSIGFIHFVIFSCPLYVNGNLHSLESPLTLRVQHLPIKEKCFVWYLIMFNKLNSFHYSMIKIFFSYLYNFLIHPPHTVFFLHQVRNFWCCLNQNILELLVGFSRSEDSILMHLFGINFCTHSTPPNPSTHNFFQLQNFILCTMLFSVWFSNVNK